MTTKPYRPVPGKLTVETTHNRICTVTRYASDGGGEFVEVRLAGSYGAHVRLPLSGIRPLTEQERVEAGEMFDSGFLPYRRSYAR